MPLGTLQPRVRPPLFTEAVHCVMPTLETLKFDTYFYSWGARAVSRVHYCRARRKIMAATRRKGAHDATPCLQVSLIDSDRWRLRIAITLLSSAALCLSMHQGSDPVVFPLLEGGGQSRVHFLI